MHKDNLLCEACPKGKQVKNYFFEQKKIVSTSRLLQLLHLDLFVPTRYAFIRGKRYKLVIVDNYSRLIWVMFLAHKDDSFRVFFKFYKRVQNGKKCITSVESDHIEEFDNKNFQLFCEPNHW